MVDLKDQDMGEGMQCITHPYTKNPGGICPLCLQEKLGKLVTSSFPLPKINHLSSPPKAFSPSTNSLALSLSSGRDSNNNNNLPFLLAKKKSMLAASSSSSSSSANLIYKRSKSTAAGYGEGFNQRKRSGFWSFLHLYSSKHQLASTTKKVSHSSRPRNQRTETTETPKRVLGGGGIDVIVDESPSNKVVVETPTNSVGSGNGSSFGRKVLRSRSVGCGSRSFSGDFFERISNGFGDCALRRIESQREPTKVISNGGGGGEAADDAMSEMVKCGGIFGGFMIMTSSSSAASSTVDHHHKMGNRSWGWAFASPMRAKTTTHRGRTITESSTTDKSTPPNLDSIPPLVAMKT
ncbi:hypothetical protein Rs2_50826 [Raphanus sativus]|uniref:Uncharacterized protein LOC108809568 n=1 Tax=Raphanus sativus TaxID=3726 RepID=A0A6J0JNN7_RAPSA|nr:uncharacterized protein LOC108809568 [Raphanus sativus]XP_056863861.1 uncharacterized protein LOC130511063 [Raphanus sativus]KAJ4867632.1 hypothetical protein Rs2_50826 [Raphanus sativus]